MQCILWRSIAYLLLGQRRGKLVLNAPRTFFSKCMQNTMTWVSSLDIYSMYVCTYKIKIFRFLTFDISCEFLCIHFFFSPWYKTQFLWVCRNTNYHNMLTIICISRWSAVGDRMSMAHRSNRGVSSFRHHLSVLSRNIPNNSQEFSDRS